MPIGCRIVQRKTFLKERIFIWMNSIQQLFEIDWKAFGITIFLVLLGLQTCIKLFQWFLFDLLGIETKSMRLKKHEHELLIETANELKRLSEKHKEDMDSFLNNRIHDREQSFSIQKELITSQENISKLINSLEKKLTEMQDNTDKRFKENEEKENRRVQAELKDKIGQSYRYYHDIKKINDIEMETLEGLIKTYEDYGGKNSFVHSLVQKEMYTWEHIDKI